LNSGSYGAIWGLGHGISSFFIGFVILSTITYMNDVVTSHMENDYWGTGSIRSLLDCEDCYKSFVDLIMGFTLLIVGVMGLKESYHSYIECMEAQRSHEMEMQKNETIELDGVTSEDSLKIKISENSRNNLHKLRHLVTFVNGAVMGLSWDGIPSLTPAAFVGGSSSSIISMDESKVSAALYLAAYSVATMVSMSAICAFFGEATCVLYRLVKQHKHKNTVDKDDNNAVLISKLTYKSSYISIVFGLLWMTSATAKYLIPIEPRNDNYVYMSRVDNITQVLLSGGCIVSLIVSTVSTVISELDWHPNWSVAMTPNLQLWLKYLADIVFNGTQLKSPSKPLSYTV